MTNDEGITKPECCPQHLVHVVNISRLVHPLRTADATGFRHLLVIRHSEFVIHTGAMLDIRLIREKPDFVRERLATRNGGDDGKDR